MYAGLPDRAAATCSAYVMGRLFGGVIATLGGRWGTRGSSSWILGGGVGPPLEFALRILRGRVWSPPSSRIAEEVSE